MLELKEGRPEDESGRLAKEIRTYDFLDRLGIRYQRVDHAVAMTMEACRERNVLRRKNFLPRLASHACPLRRSGIWRSFWISRRAR